jgi:hypothetical protein
MLFFIALGSTCSTPWDCYNAYFLNITTTLMVIKAIEIVCPRDEKG